MKVTYCRSCSAPIIWAKTEGGSLMPFDAMPTAAGKWSLGDSDLGGVTAFHVPVLSTGYVSHFATCPNAQQHRKGKR